MSLYKPEYGLIHDRLSDVDLVAAANVASGKGGPFSATILILTREGAGRYRPAYMLNPTGNAVVSTGRASAHAEDQAMTARALREIEDEILRIESSSRETETRLVFLSSAQPCMACFSKIEIFTRDFVARGLLQPGHMSLVYGAPYAETEAVAGFNDYMYAIDFLHASRTAKKAGLLVPLERATCETIPEYVRAALFAQRGPLAVVVKNGDILSVGKDLRGKDGLFATAECSALHEASRQRRGQGATSPWDLEGGVLYTRTMDIGPLIYAEAQWAGVGKIVSVASPMNGVAYDQTLESAGCTNGMLFESIADGFNNPQSAVGVFRDITYLNLAQEAWWTKADRCMYNGTDAGSAFDSNDKASFDQLFIPESLESDFTPQDLSKPQLLPLAQGAVFSKFSGILA